MSEHSRNEHRIQEAARQTTVLDDTMSTGARAYAEALLNLAERDGKADAVLDELEAVQSEILDHYPTLAEQLRSPSVQAAEKDRLLVTILSGRADEMTVKFLRLLNRNGRLELLGPILRQGRTLRDRRLNRRAVLVQSAVELDDVQRHQLIERLRTQLGAEPVVRYEVDPTLLGGLVVRLGDQVYDASLRAQLKRMRRRLIEERLSAAHATLVDSAIS